MDYDALHEELARKMDEEESLKRMLYSGNQLPERKKEYLPETKTKWKLWVNSLKKRKTLR